MDNITYALPQKLVQAVVDLLNELPARASRPLLNGIEAECLRQDAERAHQAAEKAAP